MSEPQRKRATTFRVMGTHAAEAKRLRDVIKKRGKCFVYRTGRAELLIANYDVQDRKDLVAVYDKRVTTAMLRQDIYGESPADIRFAEWGERWVA